MAWDEWDQLKAEALERRQGDATRMQLNQYPRRLRPGLDPDDTRQDG
ncbi:hypothetical protein GCM10023238_33320 [Streptomyces heliomycini]